jgi:hypothetical protein
VIAVRFLACKRELLLEAGRVRLSGCDSGTCVR